MAKFNGTQRQLRFLINYEKTAKPLREPRTYEALAQEWRISRKTLLNWRNSPEFQSALGIVLVDDDRPMDEQILDGLAKKGLTGDPGAATAWFKLRGQAGVQSTGMCPHGFEVCPIKQVGELSGETLREITRILGGAKSIGQNRNNEGSRLLKEALDEDPQEPA